MSEPRTAGASAGPATAPPLPARRRSARRTIVLLATIAIAPVAASYAVYYLFPRDVQANYGSLLPTAPAPEVAGRAADGSAFRLAQLQGRWLLVVNAGPRCGADCERMLFATRQARAIQGRDQERVARAVLTTGDARLPPGIAEQHPGVTVAAIDAAAAARLPGGTPSILLIDPLGNLVLRYAADPDVKGVARDLTRLLKASRIG